MAEFAYSAKNAQRETVRGRVQAGTKLEAVRLIEQMGLLPVEVEAPPAAAPAPARRPARGLRISAYDLCVFARQLSSFIRSQTPLIAALEFIRRETPERSPMKAFLSGIVDDVHDGKRFSDSLEERGRSLFDARFVSMIRAGEASGHLDDILSALADSLESEEEIRGQIRSATAYPLLVLAAGAATVFFLLTFAVPRLASLFSRTAATLPLPTKVLMALAQPAGQAFILAVFGAAAAAAAAVAVTARRNRKAFDRLLMRLPMVGAIRVKNDVARFCGALGLLIESGVPVHDAIEVARPVLANEVLKDELKDAQARVVGGEMFAHVVRGLRHFPPFAVQMIAVGEDSGRLPETLREVSRFYTRESLRSVKTIASLIEPLLILGLSLVVGFIVSGIMLPIFNLDWVK